MRQTFVIAAVALCVGTLPACTRAHETSTGGFTAEQAVECRELGGGWVFVRYEAGGGEAGARVGYGMDDAAGEDASDEELEVAERQRAANGWDEHALEELLRADQEPPPRIRARLERMPNCLAELRGG